MHLTQQVINRCISHFGICIPFHSSFIVHTVQTFDCRKQSDCCVIVNLSEIEKKTLKPLVSRLFLVRLEGFEPATF